MLQNLPIWKVWAPKSTSGRSKNASLTVSAVNALLVPEDPFLPIIRPSGPYVFEKSKLWLDWLIHLGARKIDSYRYIEEHLVPHIRKMPKNEANRYEALSQLLQLISTQERWRESTLANAPLFPNMEGDLRCATDLYDPEEPIFYLCLSGADKSKLPHRTSNVNSLRRLGLKSVVNKETFRVCLESLEREYKDGETDSLCERAREVWKLFLDQLGHSIPDWTREDIVELAEYHFVPVRRFKARVQSYRDGMPLGFNRSGLLATMKEIIASEYMAITWTQRLIPELDPSRWISELFDFSPTVGLVVNHLVYLATVVAPKCNIVEDFFDDLRATYQYLTQPSCLPKAGAILKNQYPDKALWLNVDDSLDSLCGSKTQGSRKLKKKGREGSDNVDSFLWLPAKRFVEGISYDLSASNLYSFKASISPYQALIKRSGTSVVTEVEAHTSPEASHGRGDIILSFLREMLAVEAACDLKIIIGGIRYCVHRVALAAFSHAFRQMLTGAEGWNGSDAGMLNLDSENQPRPSVANVESDLAKSSPYATVQSVASFIGWVYHGHLDIDDDAISDDEKAHLSLYLDLLQLTEVWSIPLLKINIENRILRNATRFIRIDNVRYVRNIASQCNAKEVEKHCEKYEHINEKVVELAESASDKRYKREINDGTPEKQPSTKRSTEITHEKTITRTSDRIVVEERMTRAGPSVQEETQPATLSSPSPENRPKSARRNTFMSAVKAKIRPKAN